MEIPIIAEVLSGLGVGGAIAVIVLFFYRRDRKDAEKRFGEYAEQLRQDRVFMEDRLTGIIDRDQNTREKNTAVVEKNTTVLEGLAKTLERMNGRKS